MKPDADVALWEYYQRENPAYFERTSRDKVGVLARRIRRLTRPGDRLCEVGLGSGGMLQRLRPGRQVMGVDLCAAAVEYLRRKPELQGVDLRQGDICALGSVARDLDAVVSIDVIEHLDDTQLPQAVAEVAKALRPGGRWFINVPWAEELKTNEIICPHCRQTFHRVGHKQSFDEPRLRALLEAGGFRVESVKRMYFANFALPAPIMLAYRLLARIYFRNYAAMFVVAAKAR